MFDAQGCVTTEELLKTFGQRLHYVMSVRKMTQWEVADKAGISHATVSNLWRARHIPTLYTVNAVAVALGVPVDWLCGRGELEDVLK